MLGQNASLSVLDLSRNRLGESAAFGIADGLKENRVLRTLKLGWNALGRCAPLQRYPRRWCGGNNVQVFFGCHWCLIFIYFYILRWMGKNIRVLLGNYRQNTEFLFIFVIFSVQEKKKKIGKRKEKEKYAGGKYSLSPLRVQYYTSTFCCLLGIPICFCLFVCFRFFGVYLRLCYLPVSSSGG